MTRKEAKRLTHLENSLTALGFTPREVKQLRLISLRLHRWYERECGSDSGCIERDDTGRPHWRYASGQLSAPIADLEAGALRRLAALVHGRSCTPYVQTDPRGCALWILRPGDIPAGAEAEAYYSRGIPVY